MKYLTLLRGINVGENNIIRMYKLLAIRNSNTSFKLRDLFAII